MSSFESGQHAYFTKELNRTLPTQNSQLPEKRLLENALSNVDPMFNGTQLLDTQGFISDFGARSGVIQRDAECRAIPYPGPAMRSPDARTGCGWWFSQNPQVPSIGAYGARRGPMNPNLDTQIGPGQWIWDPSKAAAMEGQKYSARFNKCEDIQFSQNPNIGWCRPTGRAIMTDGAGNPAFPRSAGGDCPEGGVIMNAANCNPPPPRMPDECMPNGIRLGSPSNDGSNIRVYTQSDCDLMNGNWYPNGECLKKGGGSYSAICNVLNNEAPAEPRTNTGTGVTDICSPVNGKLTPACLQTLASFSCSSNGLLARSLGSGYAGTSDSFNNVNNYLIQRGFTIHSGIVNDGHISTQDALSSFSGLKSMASTGDNSISTQAAMNMCFGTTFNPCTINDSFKGEYDPNCITQLALEMGYSPAGKLLPTHSGMAQWNGLKSWGEVKATLAHWKNLADNSTDPQQQAIAVGYVYGIVVNFPQKKC